MPLALAANKAFSNADRLVLSHVDARQDEESGRLIDELETIDDDLDDHGITLVKTNDDDVAKEYGVDKIPAIVYFENGIPSLFSGNSIEALP